MSITNIDSILCYFEDDLKVCCIELKNSVKNNETNEIIYANLNKTFNYIINNNLYKIDTKENLTKLLNSFFDVYTEFNEYKNFILDFVYNKFEIIEQKQIIDEKLSKFQKEFEIFKNNLLNSTQLNKNFVALYCNGYWSNYSFENKISKEDLLNMAKKLAEFNNLTIFDLTLLESSIKFSNIYSKDEVNKYEDDLVDFLFIYSLRKYVDNWKTIKTNQINDSSLEQAIKIQYFQELESDYTSLVTSYNKSFMDIKNIFQEINSREYMKKFCIDFSATQEFTSIFDFQNVNPPSFNVQNKLEIELNNIKKYQALINGPKNYRTK